MLSELLSSVNDLSYRSDIKPQKIEMGRKKRETMLKKKKENDLHEPITYQSGILIKIDGGIWWPGYVVEGCGTFLNEEEEFSIPLTCSNWCPIPSSVDDTKIKKSLGKLSAEYKKSYKQDLMKLQGRAPQQKKRKSNNGNEDSSPKKQKPSSPWKWSCSSEDQGVEKSSLRIDGKHTIKCPSQLSASMIESSDIQPSVHTSDIQPSVISQSSNMATPNPKPVKRSNNTESPQRKGQVKLNVTQQQCLKQIFQANVNLRKELKRKECEEAIAAHSCLKGLEWKKIKNTIHNWITNEKNKTKKILKRQEK